MFRTNIRAMEQAADEMQRQIRKLNQAISETENVISGLSRLSGMDGVKRKLRNEISRMENERSSMMAMLTGLRQIARCYETSETNILRYAEDAGIRKRRSFEWFQVKLTAGATDLLRQVIQ